MKVNYTRTGDTLYLSFDGKFFSLDQGSKEYAEVVELIKEKRLDEIPDVFNRKEVALEEYIEGSGFSLQDGRIVDDSGNELPHVLNERMQQLKEDGFPVTYLVNFWKNLNQNPSMNSRTQLYKFLEQNGHPITEDGYFIAYRGVTNDFKDKHTRTFDNSPGSICRMDRSQVDDNPNQTCSRGLHVAAFQYANDFGSKTVEVKVNPRDVVAVPTDYNGQKMRVCEFEVIQECDSIRNTTAVRHYDHVTWDDNEDELDQDFIDCVLNHASKFKSRYSDKMSLALRIEEHMDDQCELCGETVSDILKVLNEYGDN